MLHPDKEMRCRLLACGFALCISGGVVRSAPRERAVKSVDIDEGMSLEEYEASERAEIEKQRRAIAQNQKALVAAVKKGNAPQVKKLLEQGVSPDSVDEKGTPILMLAIANGRADLVRILLEANASVLYNGISTISYGGLGQSVAIKVAKDKSGKNALTLAEEKGDPEIVKMVRELAFLQAIDHPDQPMVESLLNKGVSLNSTDVYGVTPLLIAVDQATFVQGNEGKKRAFSMIEFLLRKGADINAPVFLRFRGEDWTRPRGVSILETAASAGNSEVVRLLLQHGARVKDNAGALALIAASGGGEQSVNQSRRQTIELLLDSGAPINGTDESGETALSASLLNSPWIARLLVSRGADTNVADKQGETALFHVFPYRSPDDLKMLLDAGANIDAKNKRGETALHIAAFWNQDKHARVLLARGANPNNRDGNGLTPLMRAVEKHDDDDEDWYEASGDGGALIRDLIKAGADINARDWNGKTVLQRASQAGLKEWVKSLKYLGAK